MTCYTITLSPVKRWNPDRVITLNNSLWNPDQKQLARDSFDAHVQNELAWRSEKKARHESVILSCNGVEIANFTLTTPDGFRKLG